MKKALIIAGVCLAYIAIMAGCSHNSPTQTPILKDGAIYFSNESPTALVLTRVIQTHNGHVYNRDINRSIYAHTRYQLSNLVDGTRTFPGGDRVTVSFYSPSLNPYDPTPNYSGDVAFTVNGETIVKIHGRDQYELSGN
jgi:hypothetical protein